MYVNVYPEPLHIFAEANPTEFNGINFPACNRIAVLINDSSRWLNQRLAQSYPGLMLEDLMFYHHKFQDNGVEVISAFCGLGMPPQTLPMHT